MDSIDAYLVDRCLLLAADLERLDHLSSEEGYETLTAVADLLAEALISPERELVGAAVDAASSPSTCRALPRAVPDGYNPPRKGRRVMRTRHGKGRDVEAAKARTWNVFLCYRQVDGGETAEWPYCHLSEQGRWADTESSTPSSTWRVGIQTQGTQGRR